ncbi:cobyrinate a,c-diamide synthase [Olsenella sp. YH-ols2223]|uniref:Hydrogenobyrinate a,c-diamide synthase n=1 Tax=Olsenella absiana TaxID=3115222 RepID=A0ABU7R7M7_9ACTN
MATASVPRVMVAATSSGAGKTTVTCGLLRLLARQGLSPRACKCGPDFIDPMFHREVVGVPSRNLDLYLSGEADVRRLLAKGADGEGVTVVEGVMGYYDGVGLTDEASSWDVARRTETPCVLVVDARGRARTLAAEVVGVRRMREDSRVAGVVLNRASAAAFPALRRAVEEESGVPVLGYLPQLEGAALESRHLGLVTAAEVERLGEKVDLVADALAETLDVEALLALARQAPPLAYEPRGLAPVAAGARVAVARDEAFCFYYEDALDTLHELGCELVGFSPLSDGRLPEDACGLYLGGGYPELHAAALEANARMRAEVARAVRSGLPTVAECGGFLYLHDALEGADGTWYEMAGVVHARAFRCDRLRRFGYVGLESRVDGLLAARGGALRAHEFHYWDSEDPGASFSATKPRSGRSWECVHATPTLHAGFPHVDLYSEVGAATRFARACRDYARRAGGPGAPGGPGAVGGPGADAGAGVSAS